MVSFGLDEEIDALNPESSPMDVACLIGCLSGQDIDLAKLSLEAQDSVRDFLHRASSEGATAVKLSCEEFNELLLLFNQNRIEEPFFRFFFLGENPLVATGSCGAVGFDHVKAGVTRFRGFAMLCFGNFRFAFRTLSEEVDPEKFVACLYPWNQDSDQRKQAFERRQRPLTPLVDTDDEIPGNKTWLLGYLSEAGLTNDANALEQITRRAADDTTITGKSTVELKKCSERLKELAEDQRRFRKIGQRNTTKYLTWDFLDVYVATSMRHPWEFQETHGFVRQVFTEELKDLPGVRWFDPTQAYCNLIDKGLVEGLMLKRASCTIYMAQEGDTLGKDSELAATLAQGKPVIAYVRGLGGDELTRYQGELKQRDPSYFQQRLLTLLADGFFNKPDNREAVARIGSELGVDIAPDDLKSRVRSLVKLFAEFEDDREFRVIGEEEIAFRTQYGSEWDEAVRLLAALESRAADIRAETIKKKHPLSMQVHLETGVANGVLVARSAKECANLVRGVLTRQMNFDICMVGDAGSPTHTVLLESETASRFRVVTKNECLTNSFWNFYLHERSVRNLRFRSAYRGSKRYEKDSV